MIRVNLVSDNGVGCYLCDEAGVTQSGFLFHAVGYATANSLTMAQCDSFINDSEFEKCDKSVLVSPVQFKLIEYYGAKELVECHS